MQLKDFIIAFSLFATDVNSNDIPTGRIVGGHEVFPRFQFPWIVSLQCYGSHSCGSTLFNERSVITAAHCIVGSTYSWTASIHRHDLIKSPRSESGKTYQVIDRIPHPDYNRDNDSSNDVAIWKINARGNRRSRINFDNGRHSNSDGTMLKVIGWGTTASEGRASKILLEVRVPIFNAAKCKEAYGIVDTKSQFCAGYPEGGRDACQGDSGGPIFTDIYRVPTLVGIVSWGSGCAAKGYPGIYTRVSEVMDFILHHSR